MRLSRLSTLVAGLLTLNAAVPFRAAAQNVAESAVAPVPGNLVSGAGSVGAAPSASLTATPGLLAAPVAAFASAPLAPALPAPLPLAANPIRASAPAAAVPAAAALPAASAGVPAAPLAALKDTGVKLNAAARTGDVAAAPAALDSLFERPGVKAGGGPAAEAPAVDARDGAPAPRLDASTPKKEDPVRRMPAGVRIAFQKSALMGGGIGALFGGLWLQLHSIAPAATFTQYTALALPLALIPLHFALVSGFWAGRYYLYPRLGDAGKTAFRAAWTAAAAVYPAAAMLALGAWAALLSDHPQLLLLVSPVALLAAAEVVHHFIYRFSSERRQDDGKSLLDWKSRAWGNIGQQLRRMRRRDG